MFDLIGDGVVMPGVVTTVAPRPLLYERKESVDVIVAVPKLNIRTSVRASRLLANWLLIQH